MVNDRVNDMVNHLELFSMGHGRGPIGLFRCTILSFVGSQNLVS
jgi:hypothetical protein